MYLHLKVLIDLLLFPMFGFAVQEILTLGQPFWDILILKGTVMQII